MDFAGASTFTTGPATLPDIGVLSYNGCLFSPLFETNVSGNCVKDNAKRTVMYMEYTLTADGYATCPRFDPFVATTGIGPGPTDIFAASISTLRRLLTAQAGNLVYTGRGCDIVVNGAIKDVVWGPEPKLLEFQPLGGGLSAKVRWQVVVRIPEVSSGGYGLKTGLGGGGYNLNTFSNGGGYSLSTVGTDYSLKTYSDMIRVSDDGIAPADSGAAAPAGAANKGSVDIVAIVGDPGGGVVGGFGGLAGTPLLQFNYDTTVSYGEDGFSTVSAKGTLEVPQTRSFQGNRVVPYTVDSFRPMIEGGALAGIDLDLFRITKRDFTTSRDKRVLEWNIAAEEKPYMDLPPYCTIARGKYTVRPAKTGAGLCNWLCTLQASYTVRADQPRRVAWFAFLALLRVRMAQSRLSATIDPQTGRAPTGRAATRTNNNSALGNIKAFLIDFSFDEGLYLESKVSSFSATWRLVCSFSHIMLASGLWTKVSEKYVTGDNVWATSMRSVMGSTSWLANQVAPDIIVDFGGGM